MDDDDLVFKALGDPTRRLLLDLLFARDGRTLTELESGLEMTRFGVAKHLRLLEQAGLVVARRSGREKLHFLNAVPIRLVHDRWIDKYTERLVSALADLKTELEGRTMTTMTEATRTVQVNAVWIKATPEAIWDAITKPEWTERYGYQGRAEYDLRPGGAFRSTAGEELQAMGMPAVVVDGEVIEADPPRRLVQTWRFLWSDEIAAEGPTRVTFEITPGGVDTGGATKLTVTHELSGAPMTAAQLAGEVESAGGGWSYVLSDLKTLLETGSAIGE